MALLLIPNHLHVKSHIAAASGAKVAKTANIQSLSDCLYELLATCYSCTKLEKLIPIHDDKYFCEA